MKEFAVTDFTSHKNQKKRGGNSHTQTHTHQEERDREY